MNGYLVVVRHTEDDIPVFLTSDHLEAVRFAESVKPTEWDEKTMSIIPGDDEESQRLLWLDATTPLNVSVYEFKDGKFVGFVVVRDFSEEPAK